eukprot:gene24287-31066_t
MRQRLDEAIELCYLFQSQRVRSPESLGANGGDRYHGLRHSDTQTLKYSEERHSASRAARTSPTSSPTKRPSYRVEAFPTLILFFQGREVQRYEGFKSADALAKELHVALR